MDSGTDPSALYTGNTAGGMFANESLRERNQRTKNLIEKQKRQGSQLLPVAEDILKKLEEARQEANSIGSYLQRIYAEEGKPTIDVDKIRIEFRAREMNLQLIDNLERWIKLRLKRQ